MQSHGQGEGLFGDGCLDNYKRGHVWFFIAEHSEERSYWMHYLCAPCWVIQRACNLQHKINLKRSRCNWNTLFCSWVNLKKGPMCDVSNP